MSAPRQRLKHLRYFSDTLKTKKIKSVYEPRGPSVEHTDHHVTTRVQLVVEHEISVSEITAKGNDPTRF